jgi:prepilin-type processing-associated H-X9-DG protein
MFEAQKQNCAIQGLSLSAINEVARIEMLRDSGGDRAFVRIYMRPYNTLPSKNDIDLRALIQSDRADYSNPANTPPHFTGYNMLLCDGHAKYYDYKKW